MDRHQLRVIAGRDDDRMIEVGTPDAEQVVDLAKNGFWTRRNSGTPGEEHRDRTELPRIIGPRASEHQSVERTERPRGEPRRVIGNRGHGIRAHASAWSRASR